MADEGINYQFTIDQQTAGLNVAIGKIDQLTASMSKADTLTTKHQQSNKKHEESFRGVGKAIDETKDKLHDFFAFVGAIAAFEILEKIGEKIIDIGKEALNAAAAAERMDLSFKLSLGTEGGEEMVGWLDKISGKTEFTDRQLKGWGKELLNAGIPAEEMDKYMAAALDVAAKSPEKMEGMGKAIMALSRASLTGKVDMRELRGLSIGVDQLKTLPQFQGKTTDQIHKLLEKGKISKNDLLTLIAGPDRMLGDLGLQAGKTMEARFTHLKDLPDQFFKRLSKTDAFDRLGRAIDGILTKLDPDSPTGKRISGFLETAFSAGVDVVEDLGKAIDDIDFDSMGTTIKEDVVPALKTMVSWIKPTVEAVQDIISGFHEMHDIAFGPTPKNAALDDFDRRQKAADRRSAQDEDHPSWLDKGVDVGGGARAWHGKFNMVGEGAGKDIGAGLEKGARDKLELHSPSKVFKEIGEMAAAGFAIGMGGSTSTTGAPRAGGISISIGPVAINASSAEGGQAAADAFAVSLRSQLISILEQAQAEAGA